MTINARYLIQAGAALFTICAIPGAAAAQHSLDPVRVTAAARAEKLLAEAAALPTMTNQFRKAARLYEESATVRTVGDSLTPFCLRTAAYYRYYSGDTRESATLMERAAKHSVALGDVVGAANAYIDAALIAGEFQDVARSKKLSDRAEQLMTSPQLDEAQRSLLRGRITGDRSVALFQQHP